MAGFRQPAPKLRWPRVVRGLTGKRLPPFYAHRPPPASRICVNFTERSAQEELRLTSIIRRFEVRVAAPFNRTI